MRGATDCQGQRLFCHGVSIHAPHAGRDHLRVEAYTGTIVSIHAPHAGRDIFFRPLSPSIHAVSIHAPHAGRDADSVSGDVVGKTFQSTRPMRGATLKFCDVL